ncbi:hypothetical protein [Moraxella macacae]|nr:hypothetical protein [Moraxella macacae]
MHDIVGIEVGKSRHSLPVQIDHTPNSIGKLFKISKRSNQQDCANQQAILTNPTQNNRDNLLKTKHGKMSPMPLFQGLSIEQIDRMPTEAVVVLDRIHHKLQRYLNWQQTLLQDRLQSSPPNTLPLTENRFVLDKLINQTIPETLNQYDQLARFNPHQLSKKIHANMTANDMLLEVLLSVDKQADELLNELNQQVSDQLATTYHYVKSRTK